MIDCASVHIGDRRIGRGWPCFVIAEAGVNHNGDINRALALVDAAVAAGVDAVKFQTFRADRLAVATAPTAAYQRRQANASHSQIELLRSLELAESDVERIARHCRSAGILFLSTPFDPESAAFLNFLGVSAFKIGSGDLTNVELLAMVARFGRPMILSTGMSNLAEVEQAVDTCQENGNGQLVLLHCVSSYPCPPAHANVRAMRTLRMAFRRPVGYSDHTIGSEVALASVALGACVLEKHFTLDRSLPGPDHSSSLEPSEIATLVRSVRHVEEALGDGRKTVASSENETRWVARKSLVAARDIPADSRLTTDDIAVKRPGTGLPPNALPYVLGRSCREAIPKDTLLALDLLV
jgi:N,N'-diacetyllegionaminate synthase